MSREINDKILNATLEIIAREKISGTRMHLIAKEAGMSQSNLHYYYPTKNDLLLALMEEIQKRFSKKRMESVDIQQKSFEENLHGLFEEKMDDILNHKKVDFAQFDYWVQGTIDPQIREKFEKTYDEWRHNIMSVLEQGNIDKDNKQMEMIPFIVVSLAMGASMQYLIDEGRFDLEEYFKSAEQLILNYIRK